MSTNPNEPREGWVRPEARTAEPSAAFLTTLRIEELRGRIVELTVGREVLPDWVPISRVLQVIDDWEAEP